MADLIDFGGWPLLGLLPAALRERALAAGRLQSFDDGALIHSRGDVSPGLSIIEKGAVRFGLLGADGGYTEISRIGAGHCFGEATLFAGMPRAYDAAALGDTRIRDLSPKAVARLIDEEPEFAHALLKSTTRRLYNALEFSHDLRRLPTHVHAAKLLLSMLRNAKEPGAVDVTQSDLADTLGVTRVAMNAALKRLEAQGLIRLGYGKVFIEDAARIKEWLGERDL